MRGYILLSSLIGLMLIGCNENPESGQLIATEKNIAIPQDHYVQLKDSIAEEIRQIIENKIPDERLSVREEQLYSSVLLPDCYVQRNFHPIWFRHTDSLQLVAQMIEFIETTKFHGLQPEHYHLQVLQDLQDLMRSGETNPATIAHADMLLSDAFFIVASHLYHGKVNPDRLTAEWGIRRNKPELQLDNKLFQLIRSTNVETFMERFYPPHPGYKKMVEYAHHLDTLKSLDFKLSINFSQNQRSIDLEEDTTYNNLLFKKLQFLGLSDTLSTTSIMRGIRAIQRQYGLNEDGKIGRNTLTALNHLYEEQQQALFVNMERLRWLPDSLNKKHILVNIADFSLDYIVNEDTLIHMKTVVGQQFRQTPVFNARMTYLVFSPTWTVPEGILRKDVIPAVAKDVSYLSQKNMVILDGAGKLVDPSSIDWKKVRSGGKFPYRIRQLPGGHNALGRVKFMFPNKYSVYLHDTPSKELFARDERIFSSGCIRIEKPYELAKLLLDGDAKWTEETMKEAMYSEVEQIVPLKTPVDVYIFYLTAWASKEEVFFRQDVYERNKEIALALKEKKY